MSGYGHVDDPRTIHMASFNSNDHFLTNRKAQIQGTLYEENWRF
jgi:hypothetical protein